MFKARKRLIMLLVALTLAIAAAVAASAIAGLTTGKANPEAAGMSEIQQPVPEALLPPIAAGGGSYRM